MRNTRREALSMDRFLAADLPIINRNIEHVGLSGLKKLDKKRLREVDDKNKMLVIQDHNTPLAVLLSYEKYLIIQDQLQAVMETVDLFGDLDELRGVIAGLQDVLDGKTKSLEEIRKSLKK